MLFSPQYCRIDATMTSLTLTSPNLSFSQELAQGVNSHSIRTVEEQFVAQISILTSKLAFKPQDTGNRLSQPEVFLETLGGFRHPTFIESPQPPPPTPDAHWTTHTIWMNLLFMRSDNSTNKYFSFNPVFSFLGKYHYNAITKTAWGPFFGGGYCSVILVPGH